MSSTNPMPAAPARTVLRSALALALLLAGCARHHASPDVLAVVNGTGISRGVFAAYAQSTTRSTPEALDPKSRERALTAKIERP